MPTVPFYNPRVSQAGLANPEVTVRATAADFGSQTAGAIGNAGEAIGHAAKLKDKFDAEQDQTAAVAAANNFLIESGQRGAAFHSMQGADVTEEERAKYLEDINNTQARYGESLSPRAKVMYDKVTQNSLAAKHVDAEQHFVAQAKAADDEAKRSLIALSGNEASAKYGTADGQEAEKRGLLTIDALRGLTPEAREQVKQKYMSSVADATVTSAVRKEDLDGAQREFDRLKSTGLVDAETEGKLTRYLGEATKVRDDTIYVNERRALDMKEQKPYTPADLEVLELKGSDAIQADVDSGTITAEDGARRQRLLEAKYADDHRHMRVFQRTQAKEWTSKIDGAGSVEAARLVVNDAAQNPETAWMVDGLAGHAYTKYASAEAKQAREDRLAAKDPVGQLKSRTAMADAVRNGVYPGEEGRQKMLMTARALKLPDSYLAKLEEMHKSGGTINGLDKKDVLAAVFDKEGIEQYKKHPEDLHALWEYVSATWDPEVKPNADNVAKAVAQARWKGALIGAQGHRTDVREITFTDANGESRTVPVDLATAARFGRDAEYRPLLNANRPQAAVEAEMRARGLEPNPRGAEKPGYTRTTVVGDAEQYPNLEQLTVTEKIPAQPGDLLEEVPDDRERDYVMKQDLGRDPGVSLAQLREARAKAAQDRVAYALGEREVTSEAEFNAARAIGVASYGPPENRVRGVAAVTRQLEDDLAKNKIPLVLHEYSIGAHATALGRHNFPNLSDAEWKAKVREAYYAMVHEVAYDGGSATPQVP
jgi:hypothetical protein